MPLRLAVFDFDQTLSACHLYHALAGGDGGITVPPPYSRTEFGQLARLIDLDDHPAYSERGGFAVCAFGSQERVDKLRQLLEDLRIARIECLICSRGFVGPIRRTLDKLGLLEFFSQVFANVSTSSGSGSDDSISVETLGADAQYLSGVDQPKWGPSKGKLVARLLKERGFRPEEGVLVDDTASEIQSVKGLSKSILVQPPEGEVVPAGIGDLECSLLREMIVDDAPSSPEAGGVLSWNLPTAESPQRSYSPKRRAAGKSRDLQAGFSPAGRSPERSSPGRSRMVLHEAEKAECASPRVAGNVAADLAACVGLGSATQAGRLPPNVKAAGRPPSEKGLLLRPTRPAPRPASEGPVANSQAEDSSKSMLRNPVRSKACVSSSPCRKDVKTSMPGRSRLGAMIPTPSSSKQTPKTISSATPQKNTSKTDGSPTPKALPTQPAKTDAAITFPRSSSPTDRLWARHRLQDSNRIAGYPHPPPV